MDAHAGNGGSIASPRKQFIGDELSKEELEVLKEGSVKEQGLSSKHH